MTDRDDWLEWRRGGPDDGTAIVDLRPEPWPEYDDPLFDREPMGGDPYWREHDA